MDESERQHEPEPVDPEPAASLAERIRRADDPEEIKRLVVQRELALGRSVRAIAEEFGWSFEELTAKLGSDAEEDIEATCGWRRSVEATSIQTLSLVAVLALLLLIVLQPGLLLGARWAAIGFYADAVSEPTQASGEPLIVSETDVAYLNRIFAEQSVEVGYCGLIDADRQLRPWLASIGDATETSLELSVRNCPTGAYPELALLHTHPVGDPRLTPEDRQALRLGPVDYLCIQHGVIDASTGDRADRLRCYRSADDGRTIRLIPVRIGA